MSKGLWDQEGLDVSGLQEAGEGEEGGGLKGTAKLDDNGRVGRGGINTISYFKKKITDHSATLASDLGSD